ncbi:hypothetical protein ASD39_16345 [Sphingomonas sp. Root50]|nr:hypothetical protein ASD17_13145 [Sphingomonas sp. Root1294]KQY65669.1 hypothetical protein ASD39_16345 [Sphingomonas sp. Root50]KRB95027.1 hypothetical protein ASE22_03710 [Sphingomonas sp. Root720]
MAFDGAAQSPLVWADLRGYARNAPFFSRTTDAWRRRGATDAVRTDLSALPVLDPALDPDLIIAHSSRAGSTLLARLATAEEGSILVSEPRILLRLLEHHLAGMLDAPIGPVLQAVVRLQGRRRPDAQRYVLKLNSQATRFLPQIRRAFPRTPILWLQRRPVEVVGSNLGRPAAGCPKRPEHIADWVVRRVALAFLGATAFVDRDMQILDYRDLREPDWPGLAAVLGMDLTSVTLARMQDVARLDARTGIPFMPHDRAPVPLAVQSIVRETLDPMYEALRVRRAA